MARSTTGILLLNLGGPDSLEAVRPFLYNLFKDPDIIRLPAGVLYQKPLAALIAFFRSKRVRAQYARIGGKSPILEWTVEQARLLEERLRPHYDTRVYIGMSYWKPFVHEALRQMEADGIDKCITLPLYPQYSFSTTLASNNGFDRAARRCGVTFSRLTRIGSWCEHPLFLRAWASNIRRSLDEYRAAHGNWDRLTLLFSAHGIPVNYVRNGDPYPEEVRKSVGGIMREVAYPVRYRLSFQSRVGPVEWLKPYTADVIRELGRSTDRDILVVPISFVSDHIETLFEIDLEYGELAHRAGVRSFQRVPSLNASPIFIDALAALCTEALQHT